MFCAPASIVCRTLTPVARCRIVTAAGNGSRRYFQFASGLESSWLAVSAIDQEKSGTDASKREIDAVGATAALCLSGRDVDVHVVRPSGSQQREFVDRIEQPRLGVGELLLKGCGSNHRDRAPPRARGVGYRATLRPSPR